MKPSELKDAVKTLYELRRPGFIWGPPGIGKSDIIRAAADELKIKCVDKRLAQSDPTEIKGYPWPDQAKKTMTFFQDGSLPTSGKGLLFLDELAHAPQAVQNVTFQLALDRRIADYKLPDGWVVVAAGNRTTDRSGANPINAALASRFVHIDLHVDPDEWLDWAMANSISDITRGYIRYRPKNLCIDAIEPGMRAFPTPRSWAFADSIAQRDMDPKLKAELLRGTLGEGVGNEYMGYVRDHAQLVKIERILVDPANAPLPEGPSATYAVIAALESNTTTQNFDRLMKYVERLEPEFQVVYITCVTRAVPDVANTMAYINWVRKNRAAIL